MNCYRVFLFTLVYSLHLTAYGSPVITYKGVDYNMEDIVGVSEDDIVKKIKSNSYVEFQVEDYVFIR